MSPEKRRTVRNLLKRKTPRGARRFQIQTDSQTTVLRLGWRGGRCSGLGGRLTFSTEVLTLNERDGVVRTLSGAVAATDTGGGIDIYLAPLETGDSAGRTTCHALRIFAVHADSGSKHALLQVVL